MGEQVRSPQLHLYTARWVALVQGRIAGVGLTAEAARAAAQLTRPKEKPQVFFVPEHPPLVYPALLTEIQRALAGQARQVWLVGGAIRDALLGRRVRDLDFAVAGNAQEAARRVGAALNGAFYPLDAERDVGRVICEREGTRYTLDFARLRGPDLAADLAARDFTLNALAAALADPQTLLDPLDGEQHLRRKLIVLCAPNAIADDPVRGIRAVRLAAQLDCRLDAAARAAAKAGAGRLAQVSAERQRDEFIRCLGGPRPAAALRALDLLGLLATLAPETAALKGVPQPPPHALDAWEHTLAVVDRLDQVLHILAPEHDVDAASEITLGLISVQLGRHRQALAAHLQTLVSGDRPARWLLMLAALLHDIAKPDTRSTGPDGRLHFYQHETAGAEVAAQRLAQLHFSADEIRRVRTIIAHHLRPRQLAQDGDLSRRAVYRFFRDTGEAGVDIILLSLADYLGKFGGTPPPTDEWAQLVSACAGLFTAYFERHAAEVAPPPLVTGHDLMDELRMEAGPALGEMLEAVREAQAAGEITDRAGAMEFVRARLAGK